MNDRSKYISRLHVKKGDITKESVDAIVNAANPSLLGGGGVDGAIHRAAGPELLEACRTLGGCRHGEARITKGYNLKAPFVIHTPGPIYHGGSSGEAQVLRNSYENSMRLAHEHALSSIAFPAISTGVYGYPREEACRIAVDAVLDFMATHDYHIDVYFIQYDNENYTIYKNYIDGLGK
ncbi:MAG TPA: O-acetyl-ADP-ribose deacetylase [Spirochaetota bacterium]|nr:O-acetyl-ADP-ribose deacetylase [Spirochaetota bacterium]HNT09694.1 O-acetyl-ADP-ribose deacetylase [Spirochaetota bacterium]HOS38324.1 O-acetyl-ADP-ribose deacetylase [Spirochaetota bacterium]